MKPKELSDNFKEWLWELEHKAKLDTDPMCRLKAAISRLNGNISKCAGVEIMDANGRFVDALSEEELEKIQVPMPENIDEIQKLTRIECYASEKKAELGGLDCEIS